MILVGIIAILVTTLFFAINRNNIGQTSTTPGNFQDTLQIEQPVPGKPDSIESIQSPPDESQPKKDQKRKKQTSTAEIYAAHFEPYTDDSMEPTSRGDEETSNPFESFQQHYTEGQYMQALEDFTHMTPAMQSNDNLRFLQANALMATGDQGKANQIFKEINKNGKSKFKSEALYYLGLGYLKLNDIGNAAITLKTYKEIEGVKFKDKAIAIISEIDPE
jgi:hypothetical protein